MADKEQGGSTGQKRSSGSHAVDVSSLSTNSIQNPDIRSHGRGPVKINDQEATSLNNAIFDHSNSEFYDGDEFR
ncbi:hypothetical protein [Peribacillus kribbensis]|uniref:hypothetical protein n=1 Tax=Peribacillus kribbensis TaxID=356658 RepID=UPI0003F9A08D|nr:hypothetical protein [Peribacillus kribbensis]